MFTLDGYRLRLVEENDLQFVKDVRLDYSTAFNLGTLLFTNDFCQRKWFETISTRTDSMFLIFEMENDGIWGKIGYIRLSDIDYINRSVCVGVDIHPAYRCRGFGKKAYELIFKLCFDNMNMNRVWLLVIEYNDVAINLYHSVGFINEGVQRSAIYRDGCYYDYIMMSVLKGDYDARTNTTV